MERLRSLRARLLAFLLATILLTALAQAAIAYRTARAEADELFDYQMQRTALSLRAGLPYRVPVGPGPDSGEDDNVDFVVQVWSANMRIQR